MRHFINILGLIALAGWSQTSSAQSPTTTPAAPQCNLLHDLVPDPTDPTSFAKDSNGKPTLARVDATT